jgi:RND family efflux transporter MFP subunit
MDTEPEIAPETTPASAPRTPLQRGVRAVVPVVVVCCGAVPAWLLYANPPEAPRRPQPTQPVEVEAKPLRPTEHQVELLSQGTVRPRMESVLGAEVSGRIIEIDPDFRDGALVEEGAVLVRIDPSGYALAVEELEQEQALAEAALAELDVAVAAVEVAIGHATERLAIEQAQLDRVLELNRQGMATEDQLLERRARHLASRETLANHESSRLTLLTRHTTRESELAVAASRLAQARDDLARTTVRAPFRARVVRRLVGEGQIVSPGVVLGEVYAAGALEVRLPLSLRELSFLELSAPGATPPEVSFSVRAGDHTLTWIGRVVGLEAMADADSRQVAVIAEIDPSPAQASAAILRPGMFLSARIQGRILSDVFVLPRSAAPAEDVILVVDADGLLRRRAVEVVWRTPELLVIRGGVSAGDLLCTSPVVFAGESLAVQLEPASEPSR